MNDFLANFFRTQFCLRVQCADVCLSHVALKASLVYVLMLP